MTPFCSVPGVPAGIGFVQAVPDRNTQSGDSSFVKSVGRSKPSAFPARKFEQNRWKFRLDLITSSPL